MVTFGLYAKIMTLSNDEISTILSEAASLAGCALYDFERIAGGSGMLRVYLYNPTLMEEPNQKTAEQIKRISVTHDECVQVSRWIIAHPIVEDILPGTTLLEVSSPGINRKLNKPFHFELAVGERVKVRYNYVQEGVTRRQRRTVVGNLVLADGDKITIIVQSEKTARKGKEKDNAGEKLAILYVDIDEAKVDFEF